MSDTVPVAQEYVDESATADTSLIDRALERADDPDDLIAAVLDSAAPRPMGVPEVSAHEGLLDITLEARIQFGSREMPLSELLELGSGDVLELDRMVTEPVDLLVGDRIVARGEVVVVGGNFALHVTEVLTPQPRLESVRCLP